jgi:hypothetical protein
MLGGRKANKQSSLYGSRPPSGFQQKVIQVEVPKQIFRGFIGGNVRNFIILNYFSFLFVFYGRVIGTFHCRLFLLGFYNTKRIPRHAAG